MAGTQRSLRELTTGQSVSRSHSCWLLAVSQLTRQLVALPSAFVQQRKPLPQSALAAQLIRSSFACGSPELSCGGSLAHVAAPAAQTQIGADAGQRAPLQVARASAGRQAPARQSCPVGQGAPSPSTQLSSAQFERAPERTLHAYATDAD